MIRVFIMLKSDLLDAKCDEEYILFFTEDITFEEIQEEIVYNINGFLFDHFLDYCEKYNLNPKAIEDINMDVFETSCRAYWSFLTEEMMTNVMNSAEVSPEVIDEVIEFSEDDNNMYRLEDFDFYEEDDDE